MSQFEYGRNPLILITIPKYKIDAITIDSTSIFLYQTVNNHNQIYINYLKRFLGIKERQNYSPEYSTNKCLDYFIYAFSEFRKSGCKRGKSIRSQGKTYRGHMVWDKI